jgi:hypothetical protein
MPIWNFIRRSNTALTDAGAGDNPLVRRLHHFFQIGIGAPKLSVRAVICLARFAPMPIWKKWWRRRTSGLSPAPASVSAVHLLDHAGGAGEGMAGRGCGDNNQPNIVRLNAGQVRTNADLEKMVETSDEWIVTRTGIRERRIAAPDDFFQIGIGANLARQITARTDNFGIHLGFVTPG